MLIFFPKIAPFVMWYDMIFIDCSWQQSVQLYRNWK